MKYRLELGIWGSVFAVPTQIVDRHLKLCGAAQLKVLLTLLRHSNGAMELSELAAAVGLAPGDTQDALNYWLACGVLYAQDDAQEALVLRPAQACDAAGFFGAPAGAGCTGTDGACGASAGAGSTGHDFVHGASVAAFAGGVSMGSAFTGTNAANGACIGTSLTGAPFADGASVGTSAASGTALAPAPPAHPPARAGIAPPQRPRPPEIQSMALRDPQLKSLLSEAEAVLGKMLTSSDLSTLVSLYDWAGVPADVLITVIGYCKSIGKQNMRYIEKVAVSWLEQGIDTFEKAEAHLCEAVETDTQAELVMSAFGIHGRSLTPKETAFVRQWFREFRYDLPLLRLAYERTVDRTGKVSFPYIGKILASWHEKGVRTPEDAARLDGERSTARAQAERAGSSYNIDEIEARLLNGSPKLD